MATSKLGSKPVSSVSRSQAGSDRLEGVRELAVGGRLAAGDVVGVVSQGLRGHQKGDRAARVRSTTGWTPLPWRLCVVPAGLGPTGIDAEAAGDGEPADAPGAGGVQRVEEAGRLGAEEADLVLVGDAPGEVDDVADVVAVGEGEEGVAVGDVEGLHGDPAGEERGDLGPAVGGNDDLVFEIEERAGVWASIMPSPPESRCTPAKSS